MRVTQNSIITPFENSLQDIQTRQLQEQIRISTGKQLLSLSDDPRKVRVSKTLSAAISRNETFANNIDESLNEMRAVSTEIDAMSAKIDQIRENAVDATLGGVSKNVATFGVNIKAILQDVIKDANTSFNNHYIFGGTKTTSQSIDPLATVTRYPFEMVTDPNAPANGNFSGLMVTFNGNNNDRLINTGAETTAVINTKANELFGNNVTASFASIINLYNVLMYKSDGTLRQTDDTLNKADTAKVNQYYQGISNIYDNLTIAGASNGSRLNRLQVVKDQITEENLRLKEYLSAEADTDIAKTTIDLKKDDNALQYTLQIGSRIMTNSLFDFLK